VTGEDWTTMRFDEFAERVNETVMPSESDLDRYIGLNHLDTMDLTIRRWDESRNLKGKKLVVRKGDIIIARRNWYLRRVAIAPFDALCSAHAMIVRPKEGQIDRDFFSLFLLSNQFFERALSISVGSLSPTINWSTLKSVEFEIPSIDSQKNCIAITNEINSLKKHIRGFLNNLKQTKSTYIRRKIKVKYPNKNRYMEEFGEIECVKLEEISEFITKGATPTTYGFDFVEEGVPFVRSECIFDTGFSQKGSAFISEEAHEKLSRSSVRKNDILISITGNIGQACLYPDNWPEGNINQHIARVRLTEPDIIIPVIEIINSAVYRRFFYSIKTGGAYPQLSLKQIRNCVIPLFEIEDFKQMSLFLTEINNNIRISEKQIIELTDLFSSIIERTWR